jgi:hypothetical protein
MEPELKKTEVQRKSAIENYQVKKNMKQDIFQKNINEQLQRMNERLKNRRSKSMLGKKKKGQRDKSFNILENGKRQGKNTDLGRLLGKGSKRVLDFLDEETKEKEKIDSGQKREIESKINQQRELEMEKEIEKKISN